MTLNHSNHLKRKFYLLPQSGEDECVVNRSVSARREGEQKMQMNDHELDTARSSEQPKNLAVNEEKKKKKSQDTLVRSQRADVSS